MIKSAVALVTGAGSGIGKAAALALAEEGYKIGALGHTQDEIASVVAEITAVGGDAIYLHAEISDEQQMFNGVWAPIGDLKLSEWNDTISLNLARTFLTIRATVPELKRSGGGSVVVVSSINETRTFTTPGATAYTATEAGQVAMVQQLALELARHHIRICPSSNDLRLFGLWKSGVPTRFAG